MKFLVIALVGLLLLLQYKLWLGESGFVTIQHYQAQIESLRLEINAIKERNAKLQAEVDDLKNGMAAIEERARRDLGMIKKNETFFQILEPKAE